MPVPDSPEAITRDWMSGALAASVPGVDITGIEVIDLDAPAFDVLWDRYRRAVLYAWVAATTTAATGSKWQPVEVGRTGMTRATATCADLQTLDAIRDHV